MPIGFRTNNFGGCWICNGKRTVQVYLTDKQRGELAKFLDTHKPRQLQLFKALDQQRKWFVDKMMKGGAE